MAINGAIRIVFNFVYPLTTNGFLSRGKRSKNPCVVSGKSLKLSLHGRFLTSTFGSLIVRARFMIRINRRNNGVKRRRK